MGAGGGRGEGAEWTCTPCFCVVIEHFMIFQIPWISQTLISDFMISSFGSPFPALSRLSEGLWHFSDDDPTV
jgi:hypothetical protein